MTTLSITRPREWFGRFRKLKVLLDGATVARIGVGETVVLEVEPGRHALQLEMDWCRSPVLEVHVEAGTGLRYRSKSPGVWQASKRMRSHPESFFELVPVDGPTG